MGVWGKVRMLFPCEMQRGSEQRAWRIADHVSSDKVQPFF